MYTDGRYEVDSQMVIRHSDVVRIRNAQACLRAAQARGRSVREGLIRRPSVAIATVSLLLLLSAAFALSERAPSADADSETAALIGYFNSYRASHGASSLSPSINAYAQSQAQQAVNDCAYSYTPGGYNVIWGVYGYTTGQALWNAWWDDPNDPNDSPNSVYLTNYVSNPSYHSVGVGRVKVPSGVACSNWNWLWVIVLDTDGGSATNPPTATHSPSPTASTTPSPTPSPIASGSTATVTSTASPTPTPTPTPTSPCAGIAEVGVQCTPTPTAVPGESTSPTPSPIGDPTPTVPPEMPGDADCDLDVDSEDGILVLSVAAGLNTFAPCLSFDGVNCEGLIDITDLLTLLSYIGHVNYELPSGCPPIGVIVTPSPTPTPSPTETPTPTPPASDTPTPTPSGSPSNEAVHYCILALISYQMNTDELGGEVRCTPTVGTSYDCYFGNITALCSSSSSDHPDYTCSFATGFADCVPNDGEPEYQCFSDTAGSVECLPTTTGYPTYACGLADGWVTCESEPPAPNFACIKGPIDFDCVAQ